MKTTEQRAVEQKRTAAEWNRREPNRTGGNRREPNSLGHKSAEQNRTKSSATCRGKICLTGKWNSAQNRKESKAISEHLKYNNPLNQCEHKHANTYRICTHVCVWECLLATQIVWGKPLGSRVSTRLPSGQRESFSLTNESTERAKSWVRERNTAEQGRAH